MNAESLTVLSNLSEILVRIAEALENQDINQKETLKQYNIQGCETLKAMDAREAREIAMAKRSAERHEWDKQTAKKQQEFIQLDIDAAQIRNDKIKGGIIS